jgi:FkbM family methyltransferase
MRTDMKQVGGIYIPATETHLIPFLEDRAMFRDGRGTYQIRKLEHCMQWVRTRKGTARTAIDVGAHVGLWSMHLAKHFERLECFEPHPLHADCWHRNMDHAAPHRSQVELHQCALGAVPGRVFLSSNLESSGDTFVEPQGAPHENAGRERIEVPMFRLDQYGYRDVDFLKVDCEGYEQNVLVGAIDLLLAWKPVVCVEQKGRMFAKYGTQPGEACRFLEHLGAKQVQVISGDFIYAWEQA